MGRLRHVTYAHIVSIIAIVMATGGTSYAALVVTGANIVNGSLTARKVKDGSIGLKKIAPTSVSVMRGATGPAGARGATGPQGVKGATGPVGDAGAPGEAWTSWAFNDTGLLTNQVADPSIPPNDPAADWDATAANIRTGGYQTLNMSGTHQRVVSLSGMNTGATYQSTGSGGTVAPSTKVNLSATANLTFLHRNYGEAANNTGGEVIHGRLECRLTYGNGDVVSSYAIMGSPEWVTSPVGHEVVNVAITANASNVQAGTYNVAATCVDGDVTDSVQWSFAGGNLTVLAAKQ